MLKIKCVQDIYTLSKGKVLSQNLLDHIMKDLHCIHAWADYENLYDFDSYNTDMTDNGYIAVLEGTETQKELEDEIGLTGGLKQTIPEEVKIVKIDKDEWRRVLVVYNNSYAMILWIRNYNGFDSYL